jgi:hypothetical protein
VTDPADTLEARTIRAAEARVCDLEAEVKRLRTVLRLIRDFEGTLDDAARDLADGALASAGQLVAQAFERERAARAEHRAFVEGLTKALDAHGVPSMPWPDAIDWLAAHGSRGAASDEEER